MKKLRSLIVLIGLLNNLGCQEKVFYSGDDKINVSPFKRNLLKKGGEWEMSIQEHYYTDNNAQVFLGNNEPVLVGNMIFSDEKPDKLVLQEVECYSPHSMVLLFNSSIKYLLEPVYK